MMTEEKQKIYELYQEDVHGKAEGDEGDKCAFDSFLCQVPLFDPNDISIPDEIESQD